MEGASRPDRELWESAYECASDSESESESQTASASAYEAGQEETGGPRGEGVAALRAFFA